MGLKRSKDYGKKNKERKEPLDSMKKFIKACLQAEAEDKKLLGIYGGFTAGEILFGFIADRHGRHSIKAGELLDAFLKEVKEWELEL